MNFGRLLRHLRKNILHDASDQVAGASDYLWDDETLIEYINQAQTRMAVEGLMLRREFVLNTIPLQKEYKLPDDIAGVISAKCRGDRADLARAGHSNFNQYFIPNGQYIDPSQVSELPPGKMRAFGTDEYVHPDKHGSLGTMNFRVYPAPDPVHVQPIEIRGIKRPKEWSIEPYHCIKDIPVDERPKYLEVYPEIPREEHYNMLDWAAYLALREVDRDEEDKERAADFKETFEEKLQLARSNFMRKMFAAQQWGFGRNGWSYERN